MTSIIVPAHNEEAVIGRCLNSLVSQVDRDDEIIVVCNGCTDDTAHEARSVAPAIQVVEVEMASKVRALNHGDGLATQYPRLYVDADVVLEPGAVAALVETLSDEGVDLAAPAVRYDLSASSRAVRAYYRIWSQLPSVKDDTVGRGVYGLSASGRARFEAFPDVLGDDHFVRDVVPPQRRAVVSAVHSTVRAPRSLDAVLRRKTRTVTGNLELDRTSPIARQRARKRQVEWLAVVRRQPSLVPVVPLYVGVSLIPRCVALARRLRGTAPTWDRDITSRD